MYFVLVYSCIMSNAIVIVLSVTLALLSLHVLYSIWISWERLWTIKLENLVSDCQERVGPLGIHRTQDNLLQSVLLLSLDSTAPSFCWFKDSGRFCKVGGWPEPVKLHLELRNSCTCAWEGGSSSLSPQLRGLTEGFNEVVFAPLPP